MALNKSGNYKGGKELVKYSKSKALLQKIKHIGSKASREQKFLGKTLPKLALGAAKFAWKHPITTTIGWLGGKQLLKTKPGLKFSKYRQWDKRGRKFSL